MASNKPQPAEIGNPEYAVAKQPVYVFIPRPQDLILHNHITENLHLSLVEMDSDAHLSFLFRLRSQDVVMQGLNPLQHPDGTIEDTKRWMQSLYFQPTAAPLVRGRYFYYMILRFPLECRSRRNVRNSKKIGFIGIKALFGVPEVEFAVDPEFWDKGCAVEALRCFTKAWFGLPRLKRAQKDEAAGRPERLFAVTTRENTKCRHVLERVGFRNYSCVSCEGIEWRSYSIQKNYIQD
ncbi:GNAT domain-containing protein [Aspergillus venezuelensis]